MNFIKVALFAILLVVLLLPVLLLPVSPPSVLGWSDKCVEHEHWKDYSGGCAAEPENTRCGSFCFYAVCHECTLGTHQHCSTDSDGNTTCYTQSHHISPCTLWHWNIYPHSDPGLSHPVDLRDDKYRDPDLESGKNYEAPNLNDSLAFGMLRDNYVPPTSPCTVKEGDTSRGVTQLLPGENLEPLEILRPGDPSYISGAEKTDNSFRSTSLVDSHPSEITIGDLSHLPRTPRDPGAVTLISVRKVTDSSVTLHVSGGGRVQYRYWGYYGLQEPSDNGLELFEVAPSEFRVPFHDLLGGDIIINRGPGQSGEHMVGLEPGPSGEVIVDRELQGVFSFQVRSLDAAGVSTGNSNILHEMIGMADFEVIRPPLRSSLPFSLPIPAPPAWGTPMPPPGVGEPPRPSRPSINRVSQVEGVRNVEVELAANYSDAVEYRWWPHSGALPTFAFDEWLPAPASGDRFVIHGVEPRIPGTMPRTPLYLGINDIPDVAAFNFQVRLVNAAGIPGDASEVKVLMVWGGNYAGWITSQPMIPLQWSQPPTSLPPGFYCDAPSSGHGPLSDCQILLQLADQAFATPRLNWTPRSNWIDGLGWTEGVLVQDWTGVDLVGSRVRGVVLNNAELVGVIPWSFGRLSSLRVLDLRGNELQGNIPSSMTSLHQLETLDLRDNHLVGYLPDLTTLSRLQHLQLDRNDLTGVLTDKLDGLNRLTSLGVSDNSFFGVIPPELVGYPLDVIRLAGNRFSGCIPPELRNVRNNDIDSLVQSEDSLAGPVNC